MNRFESNYTMQEAQQISHNIKFLTCKIVTNYDFSQIDYVHHISRFDNTKSLL